MTTKTFKTILIASLIAAIVLPFSTMEFAAANSPENNPSSENKEKVAWNKKVKEHLANGGIYGPNGSLLMPKDIIEVKSNESIKEHEKRGIDPSILIHQDGKTMVSIEKVLKKYEQGNLKGDSTNKGKVLPSDQYKQIATKHDDDSITYFDGYWNVPDAPADIDDATLYIFNGLMPHYPETPIAIFQPLIQFGDNGICGNIGENWEMAPVLFISPSTVVKGDCMAVDDNDLIRGTISKSGSTWTIEVSSGGDSDLVLASYAGEADLALVALEMGNEDENCDEIPGSDTDFQSMSITGDISDWEDDSPSGWCGMAVNIVNDSTVELNNSN